MWEGIVFSRVCLSMVGERCPLVTPHRPVQTYSVCSRYIHRQVGHRLSTKRSPCLADTTPLGRHILLDRHSPPGQTPPWADTRPADTPLWIDTPCADTPLGKHPPLARQTPTPGRQPPLDRHPPLRDGHCSRRYASYTFLFEI